jgi:hypothetical protein
MTLDCLVDLEFSETRSNSNLHCLLAYEKKKSHY